MDVRFCVCIDGLIPMAPTLAREMFQKVYSVLGEDSNMVLKIARWSMACAYTVYVC